VEGPRRFYALPLPLRRTGGAETHARPSDKHTLSGADFNRKLRPLCVLGALGPPRAVRAVSHGDAKDHTGTPSRTGQIRVGRSCVTTLHPELLSSKPGGREPPRPSHGGMFGHITAVFEPSRTHFSGHKQAMPTQPRGGAAATCKKKPVPRPLKGERGSRERLLGTHVRDAPVVSRNYKP
jgi:hypothetical protein